MRQSATQVSCSIHFAGEGCSVETESARETEWDPKIQNSRNGLREPLGRLVKSVSEV